MFLERSWNNALLVLKTGNGIKLKNVKLNLYSNDIHYLEKSGIELIAAKGSIRKIIFFDQKDTTKVTAVFQIFASFNKPGTLSFFEVLNEGMAQLLKEKSVNLKKKEYDPLVEKDEFKFVSTVKYFIQNNGTLSQLKSVSKSSVLSIIKSTDQIEEWLKSNHNRLKNENEIVAFLEYYNSDKK